MISHQPKPSHHSGRPATSRRGLTLVEMMISVALTLMVVFALVRVFETLGESVTDGRATIEMAGNLRSAAQLLREDLEGLTVTTLPPRSPEQGEGYLELVDGPSTDCQHPVQLHSGGVPVPEVPRVVSLADPTVGFVDLDGDGYVDVETYDTSVGDIDDILAFTTRREDQPFIGTITDPRIRRKIGQSPNPNSAAPPPTVAVFDGSGLAPTVNLESTEAEVIWWLQVDRNVQPIDPSSPPSEVAQLANAVGDFGSGDESGLQRIQTAQRYPNFTATTMGTPVRSLHRRVLLVRPDLDYTNVIFNNLDELAVFLSNNDVSVRVFQRESDKKYHVEANSLADLSARHNRACRRPMPEQLLARRLPRHSKFGDQRTGELLNSKSFLLRHGAMKDMVLSTGAVMLRKGKDIVLTDVLAFDLQVWDPQAVVRVAADGSALLPSDPSYVQATVDGTFGAFVDLGFGVQPKSISPLPVSPTNYRGLFGGAPHPKSQLNANGTATRVESPAYCTWSSRYEYDGYDQDVATDKGAGPDQGTNGRDDIDPTTGQLAFGVDDPGELETMPPYPHPIRGIKVTMRIIESGTRQVRQTSVVQDFLPE